MKNISKLTVPPFNLDHLRSLTDNTGILQHAKYSVPRRTEGYTTDDNARALIFCAKYYQINPVPEILLLLDTYLSFLLHMQKADGSFHNYLGYNHDFLDDIGAEDCVGRALWACGYALNSNLINEKKLLLKGIVDKALPHVRNSKSPRTIAFGILGLKHYQQAYPKDRNLILNLKILSDRLLENYQAESSDNWVWFEPYLTYCNGRIPQALFEAYEATSNEKYLKIAKDSFNFLVEVQIINDRFFPIGNEGWYKRNGARSYYDQQPIETSSMVNAALTAFRVTHNKEYQKIANIAFEWFLGRNSKDIILYNKETGGCYDGITPQGLNLNQGAESTISYLLASLELEISKL